MEITFKQQLVLTILDKLVLGSVVVGVGYAANRALESMKARQSLRGTLASERMPKIAATIDRFGDIRSSNEHFLSEILVQALNETELAQRFGIARLSEADRRTLSNAMRVAAQRHHGEAEAAGEVINDALVQLDIDHFWIGDDLYEALWWEYQQMSVRLVMPDQVIDDFWKNINRTPGVMRPTVLGRLQRRWRVFGHQRRLARLGLEGAGIHMRADVDVMTRHLTR